MKNKTQPPSNIPPPKSKEAMKVDQFDNHVEHAMERIKNTLQIKSKEYRRNNNPYHNFDQAAKADDVTPERALIGMMRKHEVSIRDIVNDIDDGKNPDLNVVAEKISDNVNYLILLEGLIKRRVRQPWLNPNSPNYGITNQAQRYFQGGDDPAPVDVLEALRKGELSSKDIGGFVDNTAIEDKEQVALVHPLKDMRVSFDDGETYMDLQEALKRGRDER